MIFVLNTRIVFDMDTRKTRIEYGYSYVVEYVLVKCQIQKIFIKFLIILI